MTTNLRLIINRLKTLLFNKEEYMNTDNGDIFRREAQIYHFEKVPSVEHIVTVKSKAALFLLTLRTNETTMVYILHTF